MQLGEAILETNPLPIWKSILDNGIGKTGLTISLLIQRDIDNYYWNGTTWIATVPSPVLNMTEVSSTDYKGLYVWDTSTTGFLGVSTRTGFKVRFKATGVLDLTQPYYSILTVPADSSDMDLLIYRKTKEILTQTFILDKKLR